MKKGTRDFERLVRAGFIGTVLSAIVITVFALHAIRSAINSKNLVVYDHAQSLIDVERLRVLSERVVSSGRGFLITGDARHSESLDESHTAFRSALDELQKREDAPEGDALLSTIAATDRSYFRAIEQAVEAREAKDGTRAITRLYEAKVLPRRDRLEEALSGYVLFKRGALDHAKRVSNEETRNHIRTVALISGVAILLSIVLAFLLGKTLIRLYREARHAVQMRDDFVAIVSHDLKNPLASILMNTSLIERMLQRPSDDSLRMIARGVETTRKSASQMNELIAGILDVTKIDSGSLSIAPTPGDFSELLSEVVQMLKPAAKAKSISLNGNSVKDIPKVSFDRARIHQVLTNIIGNAIKFTPFGGTVSIEAQTAPRRLIVTITDTGPGIPAADLPHVFTRHWQARKTAQMGTGLGLWITRGIIQAHGGEIWVESTPGKGTTFHFTLPMKDPAAGLMTNGDGSGSGRTRQQA